MCGIFFFPRESDNLAQGMKWEKFDWLVGETLVSIIGYILMFVATIFDICSPVALPAVTDLKERMEKGRLSLMTRIFETSYFRSSHPNPPHPDLLEKFDWLVGETLVSIIGYILMFVATIFDICSPVALPAVTDLKERMEKGRLSLI